jgi:hypothetical protein
VNEVSEATWRRRFILVNLVTIGGTILALFGILLWQTDYVVDGGSALGFGLAMIGLVISFFAPRLMAKRWKRGRDT